MRSKRTSSVSSPRCTSQASNGPGMLPESLRHSFTAAMMPASRLATWPNSTSEWPLGALVSAATMMSAPRSSGRWPYGVMVVLSATTISARGVSGGRDSGDVAEIERRVGRSLQEDQPVARKTAVEIAAGRPQVEGNAERFQEALGKHARRVVAVRRQQDTVAAFEQAEEHRGNRGHAGRKGDRRRILEMRQHVLDRFPCRIVEAAILAKARGIARKGEDRRHDQRRRYRFALGELLPPGMPRDGGSGQWTDQSWV